ncbi:zinc finger protein [Loa loa]|uniref:Zinc finger protein n=1 Tax=Loa loa TaxID=7209 RepID=A0A1S0UDW9_LOALO|nr:zinc finger protein [Loa loa]EJD73765.1 zinc finger protein [Loa loa]
MHTRKEYSEHLKTHKEYGCTCTECGKKFRSLGGFLMHKEVHQPKHHCENCNKSFTYKSTLRSHKQQCHEVRAGQKYEYRFCNATMLSYEECSKHLETHKKYNCTWPGCEKEYRYERNLREHYETHKSKFKCENCSYLFSTKRTLRMHKQRIHGVGGSIEGNPQLGDARNHYIAGQSSLGQQNHSGNE